MKIVSWNVNGLRSAAKNGFSDWLSSSQADIVCLQEVRANPNDLDFALRYPKGYHAHWAVSETPGASGVAIFTRQPPQKIQIGMGLPRFDCEGRTLVAEYEPFTLVNVYVPSGVPGRSKWFYKMAFLYHLLDFVSALHMEEKKVILCGDINIAHNEIDIERPIRIAGFLAEERDWINELLEHGFVDTFRLLHPTQTGAYTWWSNRGDLRQRNVGWRLDYIFASAALPILKAGIHAEVSGSDHCPISVEWEMEEG